MYRHINIRDVDESRECIVESWNHLHQSIIDFAIRQRLVEGGAKRSHWCHYGHVELSSKPYNVAFYST